MRLPSQGSGVVALLDGLREAYQAEAVFPGGRGVDDDLHVVTHPLDALEAVTRAVDRCRGLILADPSLVADVPDDFLDGLRASFASLAPSSAAREVLARLASAGSFDERVAALHSASTCPEATVVRALLDLATPSPVPTERSSPRVHRAHRLHQEAVAAIGHIFRSARSDDMRIHLLLLRFLEDHAPWRSDILRRILVDEALADFPANLTALRCLVSGQVRSCLAIEDQDEHLAVNGIPLAYHRLFEMLNLWLRALAATTP